MTEEAEVQTKVSTPQEVDNVCVYVIPYIQRLYVEV